MVHTFLQVSVFSCPKWDLICFHCHSRVPPLDLVTLTDLLSLLAMATEAHGQLCPPGMQHLLLMTSSIASRVHSHFCPVYHCLLTGTMMMTTRTSESSPNKSLLQRISIAHILSSRHRAGKFTVSLKLQGTQTCKHAITLRYVKWKHRGKTMSPDF